MGLAPTFGDETSPPPNYATASFRSKNLKNLAVVRSGVERGRGRGIDLTERFVSPVLAATQVPPESVDLKIPPPSPHKVWQGTLEQFRQKPVHRLVDRVIVKGKSEPVELFECENPCTPPNYADLCQRYTIAYGAYSAGHFAEARPQFETLVKDFTDGASRVLAARCVELVEHPRSEWHGVWKMDAK